MSGHTPGPWNYGEDQRGRMRVFSGEYEIVRAMSKHGFRRVPAEEREANARLIAAAPEMLATLQKIIAYSDGSTDPGIVRAASAAIAKAEGRS